MVHFILGPCCRFFLFLNLLLIDDPALFLNFLWTHNKDIFLLLNPEWFFLYWIDNFTSASYCTYVLIFKIFGSVSSLGMILYIFRCFQAKFELHFFVVFMVTKLGSTLKFISTIFTQRLSTNRRLLSRTTTRRKITFRNKKMNLRI